MRILLVDDHPAYLEGVIRLFSQISGISSLKKAYDGLEALQIIKSQKIDLVITDIEMPKMTGDKLFEEVMLIPNPPKFVFNSLYTDKHIILKYFETGYLVGYMTKTTSIREMQHGLNLISEGGLYFCTDINRIIKRKGLSWKIVDDIVLSEAERTVLIGICEGKENKDLADYLSLSIHTVKTHRKNIKKKLGITNTAGLVIYAINVGLIKVRR